MSKKQIIEQLREDWAKRNEGLDASERPSDEDLDASERPSDEDLWDEYIEEREGTGFSGTDYIESMGLEDNLANDDCGGVLDSD